MSHIYDDRHEISIPPEAHINRFDARVYLIDAADLRRTVIGRATSETTMFANDMFKNLYPDIWRLIEILCRTDSIIPKIKFF